MAPEDGDKRLLNWAIARLSTVSATKQKFLHDDMSKYVKYLTLKGNGKDNVSDDGGTEVEAGAGTEVEDVDEDEMYEDVDEESVETVVGEEEDKEEEEVEEEVEEEQQQEEEEEEDLSDAANYEPGLSVLFRNLQIFAVVRKKKPIVILEEAAGGWYRVINDSSNDPNVKSPCREEDGFKRILKNKVLLLHSEDEGCHRYVSGIRYETEALIVGWFWL